MEIIAKTYQGLEKVLAEEIKELGGSQVKILNRAVLFQGSRYTLYACNMFLRTAIRLIVTLKEARVKDEHELYKQVYAIPWEDYFHGFRTIAVYASSSSKLFTHTKYLALKSKDAIVDRFRDRSGRRPSVDTQNPDIVINIHVRHNILTISLDSSGKSLHLRGYKKGNVEAPISEVLAAGILKLSGWKRNLPFHDGMCGSGTIPIEAYKWSHGLPAQQIEREFSFKNWIDFNETLFNKAFSETADRQVKHSPKIYAYDHSGIAIAATHKNAKEANAVSIDIAEKDFFTTEAPEDKGFMILNPPYDLRLQEADILEFYTKIGDTLKKYYKGWTVGIISSDENALYKIGMRPSKKHNLMNGPIPVSFHIYEIW